MEKSRRHHFIPEFFIKGFTNSNDELYFYKKKENIIMKGTYSPSQILFEWNRNTININGHDDGIIEELYGKLDSICAPVIKKLRTESTSEKILSTKIVGLLYYFIINLLWRIPAQDFAFEKIENDVKSKIARLIIPSRFKNDSFKLDQKQLESNLFEFKKELIILSDNPIVCKDLLINPSDLFTSQFYFPISAKQIYCTLNNKIPNINRETVLMLNAIMIEQALNYVCSPNKKILETSISYYHKIKTEGLIGTAKEEIFNIKTLAN
jgi:uncharacterized protein DUF4238